MSQKINFLQFKNWFSGKSIVIVLLLILISFLCVVLSLEVERRSIPTAEDIYRGASWGFPMQFVSDKDISSSKNTLNLSDDTIYFEKLLIDFGFYFLLNLLLLILIYSCYRFWGRQKFFSTFNILFLSVIILLILDYFHIFAVIDMFGDAYPRPFTISEKTEMLSLIGQSNICILLIIAIICVLRNKWNSRKKKV